MPGSDRLLWPALCGRPLPTENTLTNVPELAEANSCPPAISGQRTLAGLAATCTPARAPSGTNQTPPVLPPAPATQKPVPSALAAPRTLLASNAAANAVEVSTLPCASTRAITRLTAAAADEATDAVPGTAA